MKPKWRTSRDDFITPIRGRTNAIRGVNVCMPQFYKIPHRYFGMRRYGGMREALKAARAYRDSLMHSLRVPRQRGRVMERRNAVFEVKRRATNTSGLIGVSSDARRWVAFYNPKTGKQKRRSWGIKKYTNEGARMLAIAWRKRMIEELR